MPSTSARIASAVPLVFFAVFGTVSFFGQRGIQNGCKLVTWPLIADIGTPLTEAECGAIFLSATKSAPKGKADMTAALVYSMVSVVVRIEGVCFAMIMAMGWYTLLFVKFEHRYPIHVAFATFGFCDLLVNGSILGLIPFGHDDGLLPSGALGQTISAKYLPLVFVNCVLLPCNLFAFAASKGGDAKSSKSA